MGKSMTKGLTLLEVLIAIFIFAIGIGGVLAALPTGINSATWVIFQDSAIHLAHSKFAEFRRDRADPGNGPQPNLTPTAGGYLPTGGSYVPGNQEPFNSTTGDGDPWRDFASKPGEPYQYFEDISRYEWKVEVSEADNGPGSAGDAQAATGYNFPVNSNVASTINLKRVSVTIRMKGTTRQMRFSQLMFPYGQL